ncbi:MAG: hypothetical protein PHX25_00495 [Candidatus Pacebacteria bacterium]|nr:hypothetical protein [Candidatus Paceibacterota bacterium]
MKNMFNVLVASVCLGMVILTFVMTSEGIRKNNETTADELAGCVYRESSPKGVGFTQCDNNNPSPALVAAVTGGVQ